MLSTTVKLPLAGATQQELESLGCEIVAEEPEHDIVRLPDGWRVDHDQSGVYGLQAVTVIRDTRNRVRIRATEDVTVGDRKELNRLGRSVTRQRVISRRNGRRQIVPVSRRRR